MSLDFYLISKDQKVKKEGSGIFIRENGETKKITREEWNKRFPDREPVVLNHEEETNEVFYANITHNLGTMAQHLGIYECLWRPDENGYKKAHEIIYPLEQAIALMENSPDFYKQFDAKNSWGTYDQFLPWLKNLLKACEENQDADIEIWR